MELLFWIGGVSGSLPVSQQSYERRRLKDPTLSFTHTCILNAHKAAVCGLAGRKTEKEKTFPGEWCVRGHTHKHCQHSMGLFTCAIYKQDSYRRRDTTDTIYTHLSSLFFPHFSADI